MEPALIVPHFSRLRCTVLDLEDLRRKIVTKCQKTNIKIQVKWMRHTPEIIELSAHRSVKLQARNDFLKSLLAEKILETRYGNKVLRDIGHLYASTSTRKPNVNPIEVVNFIITKTWSRGKRCSKI